eukprot:TRINITY_DN7394_c0_g1_i1.p1 TRINITY_DN7394_c0_g1~~TRINITY_DN7394_c0_g1_i1.p1  ORF type:complete len:498 (+),score=125.54 TRINITY_DN7394_c0_g1_i1:176-1669(+)
MLYLSLTVAVVLLAAVYWWITQTIKSRNRPAGPWPFPVIGNLWILFFGAGPLEGLESVLTSRYGFFSMCEVRNLGDDSVMCVGDMAVIKEVNSNDKLIFRNLRIEEGLKKLGMYRKGVLMNADAVSWKHHRGLILKAVNSGNFLQNAFEVMNVLATDFMIPEINSYAESGKPMIMKDFFKEALSRFQHKLVFAHSTSPEQVKVPDYVENFFEGFQFYAILPPVTWPFFSKTRKKIDQGLHDFFQYQRKEITARIAEFRDMSDDEKASANDFIISILKSNASEDQKEFKELEVEEIRSIINDLYLGLNDTTINSLCMNLYYLACNPEVQNRLHDEISQFLSLHKKPDKEQLHDLVYLNAVIMETFRRSPTIPLMGKSAKEDVQVNGVLIQKTNTVMQFVRICHNDPKVWDSPEIWNPDRFLGENLKTNISKIIPFGGGKRSCPGQALGLLNLKLVMFTLLSKFRFSLRDPKKLLTGKSFVVYQVDPGCTHMIVEKIMS